MQVDAQKQKKVSEDQFFGKPKPTTTRFPRGRRISSQLGFAR